MKRLTRTPSAFTSRIRGSSLAPSRARSQPWSDVDADGSGQELLYSMPEGDAVDPRWSRSGDAIAFVHVPSGGVTSEQQANQQRVVYVLELATRTVSRVSR